MINHHIITDVEISLSGKSAMPLRRRAGVVPGISVLAKGVFYTRFLRIEKNLFMPNTTRIAKNTLLNKLNI
jgi:hypothetical protein